MISHVVLLQPAPGTSVEEIDTFLLRLKRCNNRYLVFLLLKLAKMPIQPTIEAIRMDSSCNLPMKRICLPTRRIRRTR